MKILTVLGARPQFIKASALSNQIQKTLCLDEVILHTGQHYDSRMSDSFFRDLEIPTPTYNLHIANLPHGAMTGRMLEGIEEALLIEKPDAVLVYGDTNSTLAGALAASKLKIPVIHCEAGLRSFTKQPEEINRVLTDRISDVLFCPTKTAVNNLVKENCNSKVIFTGDIMFDVALRNISKATETVSLSRWGIEPNNFVLATFHREENTDTYNNLKQIVLGLSRIRQKFKIVFPLHPRTKKMLQKFAINLKDYNIIPIEPLSYLEMLRLESTSACIITDSGGVQKEAFFHETPCVTVRESTEWTETIKTGWNILAHPDEYDIFDKVLNFQKPSQRKTGYFGDGNSCRIMINQMKHYFKF